VPIQVVPTPKSVESKAQSTVEIPTKPKSTDKNVIVANGREESPPVQLPESSFVESKPEKNLTPESGPNIEQDKPYEQSHQIEEQSKMDDAVAQSDRGFDGLEDNQELNVDKDEGMFYFICFL
jgi:hypothetical protein